MSKPSPRPLLAVPAIFAVTPAAASAVIVCAALGLTRKGVDLVTGKWAALVAALAGMELSVEGAERVDRERSYVVVSNHQSHMDVIALFRSSPVPLRMLAKKSLFRIPIFGAGMLAAGHIPIDRQKGKTDFNALARACEGLRRNGRSIMIFPEGSRSPDGALREFKSGAFHIAANLGLPILPVSIRGTYEILPAKSLRVSPGPARIEWHTAIEPDGKTADALAAEARAVIDSALARPVSAAPA